jgi:hypothetical protein
VIEVAGVIRADLNRLGVAEREANDIIGRRPLGPGRVTTPG